MAISNYSELQNAVANWMARSDVSGDAADFIMLAEAKLNREIPAVETDQTLTGTADSRVIDVSAYSVVKPKALFLVDDDGDECELVQKADGTFPYRGDTGEPQFWSMDGTNIKFDRLLDEAYSFRFEFTQRFALSASATTNWLLTNHPDVYLAATLIWGGVFVRDNPYAITFAEVLSDGIPSVKNVIAQQKRGRLTVDRALIEISRRCPIYDGTEIE